MVNGESPFMVTTTATGARYQLPVRPQVAWIGTVRVAMGCLGVAAALLCAADSFSQADTAPFAVQLLISLAAIPLAVLMIFHGLWLRLGYDEIVVEGGTLKGVRRVRGYGWTRSRSIAGLRRHVPYEMTRREPRRARVNARTWPRRSIPQSSEDYSAANFLCWLTSRVKGPELAAVRSLKSKLGTPP